MTPRIDELSRLVAVEDIRQMKSRYFRFVDNREFDSLLGVFAQHAIFDCADGMRIQGLDGNWRGEFGQIVRGRDEIVRWIAAAFVNITCVHHGHGHEVTIVDRENALGVVAMEDRIFGTNRTSRVLHSSGKYDEIYCIEDGVWRIAYTKLTRFSIQQYD